MGGKAALILVMGFGFIFGYIAVRINELESRTVSNTSRYFEVTSSHNLAVSGANVGLSRVYQDTSLWSRPLNSDTVITSQDVESGPLAGGSFAVNLRRGSDQYRMDLISISRFPSAGQTLRDTVIIALKEGDTTAIYAVHMAMQGNTDIWITKDTTWGRVHFNGPIEVRGTMTYMDRVSTSGGFVPAVGVGTNQAIFKNGYAEGMAQIPTVSGDPKYAQTASKADTLLLGDNWSLEFVDTSAGNDDGFVKVRKGQNLFTGNVNFYYFYNSYDAGQKALIYLNYGFRVKFADSTKKVIAIGDGKHASIKGLVDGQVTVAAENEVRIEGNIRYTFNPESNPWSPLADDVLGLVARQKLWIDVRSPVDPPDPLIVQAVLISMNDRLESNFGTTIRSLYTFGAMILQNDIRIADYNYTLDATPYIDKGFYKCFKWDPRLTNPAMRPPWFPKPDNAPRLLQIVNWWENVRIPEY